MPVTCKNKTRHGSIASQRGTCPECNTNFAKPDPRDKPGKVGAPGGWEDEKAAGVFLTWIAAGNSDARAARAAGWSPMTIASWKRWVANGIDSMGKQRDPPNSLIGFMKRYSEAQDHLHNVALKSLNNLVAKKEHFPAVKMALERAPEWRPRSIHEHTSPPGEGVTVFDVREVVLRASSVKKKGAGAASKNQ